MERWKGGKKARGATRENFMVWLALALALSRGHVSVLVDGCKTLKALEGLQPEPTQEFLTRNSIKQLQPPSIPQNPQCSVSDSL